MQMDFVQQANEYLLNHDRLGELAGLIIMEYSACHTIRIARRGLSAEADSGMRALSSVRG
jgi:hypothetical protein